MTQPSWILDSWDGGKESAVVDPSDLPQAAAELGRAGARLMAMFAADERRVDGRFRLYTVWSAQGRPAILASPISAGSPWYPALTPTLPAAHWYEREIHDLFGIEPVGHPNPGPLVLHDDWPRGVYPLRKDFTGPMPPREAGAASVSLDGVTGSGIVGIPVGPVHAGIIEPGHFRFHALGEQVFDLKPRLSYVHRGLEKAAEGRTFEAAVLLAERLCAMCTVSHAWSFCRAVEDLCETEVPARARAVRAFLGELERLHNHVGDIGNIAAGVGLSLANSHGLYLRERLMQVNGAVSGHRFLRGCIVPGGVAIDLDEGLLAGILAEVDEVVTETCDLGSDCLSHDVFRDRLTGTGFLGPGVVEDLGVVGVAARGSGIARDARLDYMLGYSDLPFEVVTEKGGDVLARYRVRLREIEVSRRMLHTLADTLPSGPLLAPLGTPSCGRPAVGITESARGENVHVVIGGPGGTVERWFARSASYTNWPAVALAVPGNIVPDFPLINKSFELCYACLDR